MVEEGKEMKEEGKRWNLFSWGEEVHETAGMLSRYEMIGGAGLMPQLCRAGWIDMWSFI